MQYALINAGQVVNIIEADADFIDSLQGFDAAVAHDQAQIGWTWDGQQLHAPAPPPAPPAPPDPRQWWIDVGPFYDRFGADALAIAASDHGACKAVQIMTGVRQYVDLKDPRIGQMIDMLIAMAQPAAQPWAPGSGPMTEAKKDAILNTPTTDYERHIKGLPDPQWGQP